MNMIGYIKKSDETFKKSPANVADALLMSWVAYFDFSYVKDQLPLKLEDFKYINEYKKLDPYISSFVPRYSRRFLRLLYNSPRFKDAELLASEYILDKKKDTQFAVIAVRCDKDIIVAVRGTDPSYTGWKEDFQMSFKDKINSYSHMDSFIKRLLKKYRKENLILCGHSKGGNICTYLLSQIEDDSRIKKVYSFDGPGFRAKGLFKDKEDRLEKYTKFVPQSSVVGVLFSNETDIKIIKSRSLLLLQHNPFEWVIKNNDFVYLNKRTISSRYLEQSLNYWIESLNEKDRERFTEIIFGELDNFKTQDITTFFKTLLLQISPAWKAYRGLDKEDKKVVNRVVKRLFKSFLMKPELKKLPLNENA